MTRPMRYRERLRQEIPDMRECKALVSAYQASLYLGRCTAWVKQNAKALGGRKIGRQWMFEPSDVVAYGKEKVA